LSTRGSYSGSTDCYHPDNPPLEPGDGKSLRTRIKKAVVEFGGKVVSLTEEEKLFMFGDDPLKYPEALRPAKI
jgi:hypothetical protein